jgi:hypothetical protein
MNKRQRKKLDNKLRVAIRELNDDVAIHEGYPPIADEEVEKALKRVKQSRESIYITLRTYERFITE